MLRTSLVLQNKSVNIVKSYLSNVQGSFYFNNINIHNGCKCSLKTFLQHSQLAAGGVEDAFKVSLQLVTKYNIMQLVLLVASSWVRNNGGVEFAYLSFFFTAIKPLLCLDFHHSIILCYFVSVCEC